ncbi:SRPBCC family protein [Truepera radiovictrix]|uniref:Polyketide cyclase/dehydrase n=1 Tax=Truepera radiovictrix (strain DSM 17093 / CIP 108686 / LMG 22925 / RQ-24) TaxID=649638 RepID=D7CXJ6_TRURR|nr:SRPBCC family protein [Truepera radiovictrix]ADI14598.1 Polyketide cyclase/dehydrase [Truepera radiovictrix DSM 17093]WMT56852.1 SRPBCC family protein [Truepera radiovictrix]
MSEFEHSTTIQASPDEVFAFIGKVENLPKYLPTTKSAQPQGSERVRVQGEARGHPYDADGYFRRDAARHRLEWGADEGHYSGWLAVEAQGEGAQMTVHLSFSGGPPAGEGGAPGETDQAGPNREQIQEGLVKALLSIKNFVEKGRSGGKEAPSAAT